MSESSEATSEHSVSARMESGDKESHSSGCKYTSDEPSIFERETSTDSPLEEKEETNPSGKFNRKIILPSIWSVNIFPISIMNEVFSKLRPHFQILDDIPIRKAIKGEKGLYCGVKVAS